MRIESDNALILAKQQAGHWNAYAGRDGPDLVIRSDFVLGDLVAWLQTRFPREPLVILPKIA